MVTLVEIESIAKATAVVLGSVSALCTVIGNPLAQWASSPKASNIGHLIAAFGVDLSKISSRILRLLPPVPKE